MGSTTKPGRPAQQSAVKRTPPPGSSIFTQFMGLIEAQPRQQSRMSLGLFSDKTPPKGFCVVVHNDAAAPDSVTSRISQPFGSTGVYELMLHLTNFGSKKVEVEVWQM